MPEDGRYLFESTLQDQLERKNKSEYLLCDMRQALVSGKNFLTSMQHFPSLHHVLEDNAHFKLHQQKRLSIVFGTLMSIEDELPISMHFLTTECTQVLSLICYALHFIIFKIFRLSTVKINVCLLKGPLKPTTNCHGLMYNNLYHSLLISRGFLTKQQQRQQL